MFKLRFHLESFCVFILLFILEVLIALFLDDKIIRPYGGDYLVVILLYYFLKTFSTIKSSFLLIFVLLFSFFIEILQLFDIVNVLGIENKILRTVIGTSFSWGDLVAYTLGVFTCYVVECYFCGMNKEEVENWNVNK